jgi:DNA-directed RNA polymerase subunit RPC12/RpoP
MLAIQGYAIGEQPGNGAYRCSKCGTYVAQLLSPDEQLPPCEKCGSADDVRYLPEDREATQSHGPA